MKPGEGFNPMLVSNMSSDEILDALNVNLKVNGLLINDLIYKLPPAKFTENFERQLAKALNINSLLRGEAIKAPEPVKKKKVYKKAPAKYHKISIGRLPKHIGDYVLITTKKGNKRKGRLMRVDKNNLYVEKRVSGGKFTMTVPRPKIKSIQAYYSK